MKRLFLVALLVTAAFCLGRYWQDLPAQAVEGGGAGSAAAGNGDVNGDREINIADASYLLNWLFLGGPAPVACPGSLGLPDTGLDFCFDCSGEATPCVNCSGRPRPCAGFTPDFLTLQDAFQGTGCPNDANRFTVNADDTVTDHCTGLQWQRFAADVDGNGSADAFGWCDALSYCFDLTLAGHGDWRLPNVRELESLIDYGEFNPASNPVFRIPADQFNQYWTSTSSIVIGQAYYIDFAIGEIKKSGKDSALHVRAVRGGF